MTPQKFLEGLQADMRDIEAAPPDVRAMRRTFTVERILSGRARTRPRIYADIMNSMDPNTRCCTSHLQHTCLRNTELPEKGQVTL
jgi:hypothetical protein